MKKKKKQVQTFIRLEKDWKLADLDEVGRIPGTRLLVGKECLHVINVN